ncbi:MAG: T9SS type A sorting domain-containing protein [Flavobacteriales bacterium]|nr:T9SS type A sorting domain-containing protein [Flavobacteriales bacterium]
MKIVGPTLTALLLVLGTTTFAQSGSLDSDFHGDGLVTTSFGTGPSMGASVVIQLDGKVIVAGYSYADLHRVFALARYNTDGSLDNSFGASGKVTTGFGTGNAQGWSVAIQPDGKIVVVGSARVGTTADLAIARYNTSGTLDTSFGIDGKVTTDYAGGQDYGYSVAIQHDGRIVVAGSTSLSFAVDLALARYNMDGTLDGSFGVGGKATTAFGTAPDQARSVVIQPDGMIVVAGFASISSGKDFVLARYDTNGNLDSGFGVEGKVIIDFAAWHDYGYSVLIDVAGKIVVAGYAENATDVDFALARFNTNGIIDPSFGVNGKVITDFAADDDYGFSVAIQQDGKIVVAGNTRIGIHSDFAMARYNTDGTLDNSFGGDGQVTTDFGTGYNHAYAVAIQPNGRIVVAGFSGFGDDADFAVARYLSGLDIGVIEFSLINNALLIYPNPIQDHATLKYTLQTAETITIQLLDMQGKAVQTFVEGQHQAAGAHQQAIDLPEALPSGSYLIAISSPKGRFTVQVVK